MNGETGASGAEEFIQSLPPAVQTKVNHLKGLQSKYDDLDTKFQKEVQALEAKYAELYEPLLKERAAIISGEQSAPDEPSNEQDGAQGIPNFWLRVLQTHPEVAEQISEKDAKILEYLVDIREDPVKDEDGDEQEGFRLVFRFAPQEYFSNSELTKTYYMADDEKQMLEKSEGSKIEWSSQAKNPAFKLMRKRVNARGRGRSPAQTQTKLEPVPSFFNFFSPPPLPSAAQALDEEAMETLQQILAEDYETGDAIRDIIPNAVNWYTGEALEQEEDDDDDDDEDDEDEDDDDDDDDDEDDDDESEGDASEDEGGETQPALANGQKGGVPEDTGEKPQECKQQ